MHKTEKQIKKRRQTVLALISISIISVIVYVLFSSISINTINDIKKDVTEEAYITYTGKYYIEHGITQRRALY